MPTLTELIDGLEDAKAAKSHHDKQAKLAASIAADLEAQIFAKLTEADTDMAAGTNKKVQAKEELVVTYDPDKWPEFVGWCRSNDRPDLIVRRVSSKPARELIDNFLGCPLDDLTAALEFGDSVALDGVKDPANHDVPAGLKVVKKRKLSITKK